MSIEEFQSRFTFDPSKAFMVGVEREMFLLHVSEWGGYKPWAKKVLEDPILKQKLGTNVGYELSACQLETRVGPCSIDNLLDQLACTQDVVDECLSRHGLEADHREVAHNIPLEVYPDERYSRIVADMPPEVLQAACRIIGTHIHIGMPDLDTALRVYNRAIKNAPGFWLAGDNSEGERKKLYGVVAPNFHAPQFWSWSEFYADAVKNGYDKDPRKNWREIRISRFGTLEFRLFGTTKDARKIYTWASNCRALCLASR